MRISAFFLFLLLLNSCKEEDVVLSEPSPEPLAWQTGRNEYNLEMDGVTRNFIIHVPTSYDGNDQVPVVFMLHGSGGNGQKFYEISRWVEKGEAENILTVFPTALEYTLLDNSISTKWSSANLASELPPDTEIKDDILFLTELVDLCKITFLVRESQIYISGFSNGGGFVKSQVIPRMSDVFAASNSTGGVGIPEVFPVDSDRIMPHYNISGSQDSRIMQSIGSMEELPLSGENIEANEFLWTNLKNMCSMLQVDTVYLEEPNIPAYNTLIFNQPVAFNAPEYLFVMVKGLEHRYPNGGNNPKGVVAADLLWTWFEKQEL